METKSRNVLVSVVTAVLFIVAGAVIGQTVVASDHTWAVIDRVVPLIGLVAVSIILIYQTQENKRLRDQLKGFQK